jgi:hypothetical protein
MIFLLKKENNYMEIIREGLQVILQAVLYVGIPVLSGIAVKYINDFFAHIKQKSNNEHTARVLDRVSKTIEQSVSYVSQTYVKGLKSEGNFNAEAQKTAFQKALELSKDMMCEEAKSVVQTLHVDLDKWLETKIENAVAQSKKE